MLSGLKARLFLVLLVAAIPVLGVVGTDLADEYDAAVNGARAQLRALASAIAANQASVLAGGKDLLLSVASRRSVDERDEAGCSAELAKLQASAIGVLNAGIVLPDSKYFCSALPQPPGVGAPRDRGWFRDAVADDALSVGTFQIGRVTKKPSINLALGFRDQRGERAIAYVALDLDWLERTLLGRIKLPPDGYLMVLDRDGTVVAGSGEARSRIGAAPDNTALGVALRRPGTDFVESETGGVATLAAVETVSLGARPDLFVAIVMPRHAITDLPLSHLYWSLAVLAVMAGVVLIVAWLIIDRSIARPIAAIGASAARLGSGESGIRIVARSSVQEIAVLERSFDAMAAKLDERSARLVTAMQVSQSSHDRLNAVILASPAAIICLDRNCNVILWNPAAERLFGWPAAETIGKQHPVVPPSEWVHFITRFERTLAGESVIGARATRRKRSGQLVEVTFNSAPLHDEAKQRIGVLYVVNDLTAQMQTEKQLHQAQKMEAVGQLTGGIAHDFNNLLGVAVGNLDIVLEMVAGADVQEYAQSALDACLRGAELTQQLLAFSRRQPLRPQSIDPTGTVRAITRLLKRTLGDNIELRLQVPDGVWRIVADPVQLEAAIVNLAVNARDAMPKGGALVVEAANAPWESGPIGWEDEMQQGDYVLIVVADTGTGMSPEVVARAFEPFFTTKETGKGTGLGLSMVYGFIKQSGGHIKIYSAPGCGTTIKLWLPREPLDAEPAAAIVAAAPSPVPRGTERILAVEDNAAIRKVVAHQLAELGYQVIEASDGPSALDILRQRDDIDLLFTDVMMPGGLDGHSLAREAQALRPGLRVLFTSGFHESHGGRADAPEGPLLSKPYRKQQLAEMLRAVLGA